MNDRLAPVLSLKTKVNGAKHKVEENGGRSKTKGDRPLIFDVTSNKNNKFAAADLLAVLRHLRCFLRTESSRGQRVIHSGDVRRTNYRMTIEMKCEEIRPKLSAYLDDFLLSTDSARINKHLECCPLCRQHVSDLQDVRTALRSLPRPQVPPQVVNSIKHTVAAKLTTRVSEFPVFLLSGTTASLRTWLTSYAVGACASLFLSFSLLWTLSMPLPTGRTARSGTSQDDLAASSSLDGVIGDAIPAREYALARSTVAAESPSVNPHGTLVELTKALVNGDLRDDEVVVVADVYENGSAHIAEVVEPSRDRNAVNELAKALDGDSIYTPFVPAAFDRRSDTVRVVFKIQSVDVDTREKPRSRRKSL